MGSKPIKTLHTCPDANKLICSFEERLVAQRKERELATAELGFKKPLSKEEKIEKKKQRLAAIGTIYIL